ncbi:MAG: Gfo/Idh/MocA family oxidoreductase [Flavisolibacter sp.]
MTPSPIQTAILSFGMSGQVFHAPFLAVDSRFQFSAVWERSKNLAEQKYPGVKTYRKLEDLLSDDTIELVIVNTPNYSHFEYVKKSLEAGKHVVVEKPFTSTVKEGQELIAIAKKKGKLLSVYQNRRFDSDYRTVKQVVESGILGRIVEAELHFDRYKEDLSPKVHKETPGPGTGVLYDLGSHLIDQALQLFGMPDSIFADIQILRPGSQVDDYFELLFYYPQLRVRVHSSYVVREPLPSYIFHGTKGSFIKAKTDIQEAELMKGAVPGGSDWGKEPESEKGLLHAEKNGKEIREYIPSLRGNYGDYYEGIYRSIRLHEPVVVAAEQGLDVIRIIEAAKRSNEKREVIDMEKSL